MKTLTANTAKELKKLIASECNFTGKKVISINGNDLSNRNDLPSLDVSNKHVILSNYVPNLGNRNQLIQAPYTVIIK